MSRVIKFRAWNGIDNSYIDWMTLCGMPKLITNIARGKEKHYQLEQFTGLTDKNGIEIYEGDIVRWGHIEGYIERNPRIAIVEMYIDLSFMTVNLGDNNHRFHYGNFMYKNTHQAMEVIGNIHQNPELTGE
ncbi:hypothetical protein NVP1247A_65 [Vibrio phage 1.247.A._10N.261.54.E12]|nr:hypothetical protein NVP1247A_65 [Vibrio phage 1.247.A._10N.261.54.E12]AUR98209.1 hypothetical protein NVP1247B_65 [Vibrio phage 1.247.B._10N.261.54.E12]